MQVSTPTNNHKNESNSKNLDGSKLLDDDNSVNLAGQ